MRIFQMLHQSELSVNQLARLMPDVPRPSLYRHVHQMLQAGVIEVVRTRHVNGLEERFYLSVPGLIDPSDVGQPGGLEQFADFAQLYGCGAAQELGRYVLERGEPDLDSIAVRDHFFYATDEEFLRLRETIFNLLADWEAAPRTEGRVRRRMFVLGHPMNRENEE